MSYYVYILASKRNGTLYVGVTNDLAKRVTEHKSNAVPGFTKTYGVKQLVYFESFENLMDARLRENRMKKWKRDWKLKRIEELNPTCKDLYAELTI